MFTLASALALALFAQVMAVKLTPVGPATIIAKLPSTVPEALLIT